MMLKFSNKNYHLKITDTDIFLIFIFKNDIIQFLEKKVLKKYQTINSVFMLSIEEQEIVEKGKKHWNLEILSKRRGGYVDSETIKDLIDKVIENTWTQAKVFYGLI
jgi:hypothetical protein